MKRLYARTNKIRIAQGIRTQQRRERLLRRLQDIEGHRKANDIGTTSTLTRGSSKDSNIPFLHFVDQEPLPRCSPDLHYQVSTSQKYYWDISAWCEKNQDDLAVQVRPRICRIDSDLDKVIGFRAKA